MNSDDPRPDAEPARPLDPETAALAALFGALLEEKLEAKLQPLRRQIERLDEDAKARYVDLRSHLSKLQASLDILNNKFDALGDEVRFLRKSVRALEDKTEAAILETR